MRLWNWVLKNAFENDKRIVMFCRKHVSIFMQALRAYFEKTLPVTRLQNGLWSERGGRYFRQP